MAAATLGFPNAQLMTPNDGLFSTLAQANPCGLTVKIISPPNDG
jgi:hypothetical protein